MYVFNISNVNLHNIVYSTSQLLVCPLIKSLLQNLNLALILTLHTTSIKAMLLSQTNLQTFQVSTPLEILGVTKVSLLILTPYLINFPNIPEPQTCAPLCPITPL